MFSILPKHANINSPTRRQLEELGAQDTLLVALGQQYAVVAHPPLDALLQARLDVDLDDQLGVLAHAAHYTLLGSSC